ncbi:citrate synthase/methylcitrate synthase [Bacillus thuringiensis]|uniref:citrate synthase/methylcitrate synthase n=2 Tax=Bacillus thuringiensis TaxID=1428 RepID=UPI000A3D2DA9|nr:citrate synthase/methylcitrate synthase [Bacillus thuringiensis]MED3347309.1 citrate synthase/methylcitrate synthase [Bacillus thuringiensis]MRB08603.1 citrate synthase/methylcitrate synthase [Bacillus thuringiensis]OTW89973.1 citrate synthase/methylcitrate synthase [Bacillus thuringiensis serovar fukuokaensis]OTW93417.1 citrate synthase/methylcitrate synthase [Bacillus thuringiensis serovar sumiyoshiensis]PEB13907.1 citrate synthase/methylcitrate synthase [Bacillus thuringiensis]
MEYRKGLEGVVAAETSVGLVDGKKGHLVYRGYWAKDLAINNTFEEVAYLIWNDKLPNENELKSFTLKMKQYRQIPNYLKQIINCLPKDMDVMSVLRTAISALGSRHFAWPPTIDQAMQLTAILPSLIAYKYRLDQGKNFIEPNDNLDHVSNFIYMLDGQEPTPAFAKALNAYLILTIEHGMNASTFASRVVASTESEIISGICAAIGAMKGPLHGGAPSEVINMLDEIGTIDNIEPWVRNKLETGGKIMGFGHRIYKSQDPRAEALKIVSQELTGESAWFNLAIEMEKKTISLLNEYKPGRCLYTNVEFFAAAVLKGISLPKELFTPMFTSSRMVGWTAHILEQAQDNRIFRPLSSYVGKIPEKLSHA